MRQTTQNALINARRAKECKNYRQAKYYYDLVKMEEPENWEATFYSTFCEVIEEDILQATKSISICIKMVLRDIKKLNETTEQKEAIKQIETDLFDYVSQSKHDAEKTYEKSIGECADARNEAYSVMPLGFTKLGEIDQKLQKILSDYISGLVYMLLLFGNELVSEFGENEFTNSINIRCHETAFKMTGIQRYADKLKKVNPSSHTLKHLENKGWFTKLLEENFLSIEFLGCGVPLILFALIAAIVILVGECTGIIEVDPAEKGLTSCQRKYYDGCFGYPYIINGERMYADGKGKDGRIKYISHEETKQRCRRDAIENCK